MFQHLHVADKAKLWLVKCGVLTDRAMDPQFRFAHHLHSLGNPLVLQQEDPQHNDHDLSSAAEPMAVAEQALGRRYFRLIL
jgi:hypothetical protein